MAIRESLKLVLITLLLNLSFVSAQKKIWKIDPAHSKIGFDLSYFKVGEIKGVFDQYEGSFTEYDEKQETYLIKLSINTASINTNQKKRDEHLISSDFFDAEKHPKIAFESTSFTKIADKEYRLEGNLTMSGITRSIILKATYKGSYVHPRFKNNRKFFTISGEIPREDFKVGTNYKPAAFALGKKVNLEAEIHLIEK